MGGKRKSGDGPGRSAPKVKAVKVEDAGGASAAEFEYVERFRQWWQGTKSIVFLCILPFAHMSFDILQFSVTWA